MKLRIAVSLLLLAGGVAAPVAAQGQDGPTVTGESGLFTLLDGWTLPRGEWSFGLYYNNWDRLVAPVPGVDPVAPLTDDWDYDWHRLSASVGWGATDRLEFALMLPWEMLRADDNHHLGVVNGRLFVDEIDASGIGNARLGAKYRFWADEAAGRALAGNLFVELPTGDDDEGVVTGDTGWGLGLDWSMAPGWVARVGFRDPGDADDFDVAEEIEAGVGNVARLNERFDWITELAATLYQGGDSSPDDAIDLTTGGRYWVGESGRWAVNFGLRLELNQLSDTDEHCPIGGLAGLTFYPRRAFAPAAPVPVAAPVAPPPAPEPAPVVAAPAPAPEPAPVAPPPPAPPREVEELCLFDSGSARVDNRCRAVLDEVALRLKEDPAATARIIGHADAQGSPAVNDRLAMQRAEAARKVLVERHGIDPSRVSVESRGSAEATADNATAEGRTANRRAVIIVRLGS